MAGLMAAAIVALKLALLARVPIDLGVRPQRKGAPPASARSATPLDARRLGIEGAIGRTRATTWRFMLELDEVLGRA